MSNVVSFKNKSGHLVYLTEDTLVPLLTCIDSKPGVPSAVKNVKWFGPGVTFMLSNSLIPTPLRSVDNQAVALINVIMNQLPELFSRLHCIFEAQLEQDNGRVLTVRYTSVEGIKASLENPSIKNIVFTINGYV